MGHGACGSAGWRRRACWWRRLQGADGFPWSSWAGSLNLFVWFVVGTYLIWGCGPRYRLLGLTVMPLAAVLFLVARFGGGTDAGERSHYGNLFLVLHVGCVLAAFAGFTLAAALAGIYLLEDRRLKNRSADILSLRLPSLVTLDDSRCGPSQWRCPFSPSVSLQGSSVCSNRVEVSTR